MKYLKMIGLAVVAAMALVAFVGASSASAVTLCKANEETCAAGNRYPSGTVIKAHSPEAVLKGFATVTCESDVVDETKAETGNPLLDLITSLTFTNCKGCEKAEAINLPYKTELFWTSGTNGSLKVSSDGKGSPGANLTNCSGFNCTFVAKGGVATLSVTGGNPAKVTATNVALERTGGSFLCGGTATWNAVYTATSPTSIWVSKSP
jgi:hypothetical protein